MAFVNLAYVLRRATVVFVMPLALLSVSHTPAPGEDESEVLEPIVAPRRAGQRRTK